MNIRTDNILFAPLLLALSLFAACGQEESVPFPDEGNGEVRLDLSARMSAGGTMESRATGDEPVFENFADGTYSFGTWVCHHEDEPADFVPTKNGYANIPTAMTVSKGNQSWLYTFPNRPATSLNVSRKIPIDIYMFSPRPTTGTQAERPDAVPFTSGSSDWMWAKTSVASDVLTGDKVSVPIKFSHAMTCLRVAITARHPGSSLTSITLKDGKNRLYASGILDLAKQELVLENENLTGQVKVTNSSQLSIDPAKPTYVNIFMPPPAIAEGEKYAGDFVLSFVFNGNAAKTEFIIPKTINAEGETVEIGNFEAGKRYTYRLTLDNPVIFAPVEVDDQWETVYEDLEL
ncbi:fimbrillin family protein [Parabacteroides distasonis]|uniref:fimbrillin family protein n=1 Tax=Parabacteroides distasonis TaxID=823 RepID=UPI002164415D|nr:fimbrillin family protein [Parabacteroides distasonis]UVR25564.1 fimbrillin family protein [Parabacteroides distasonis]